MDMKTKIRKEINKVSTNERKQNSKVFKKIWCWE